MMRYWGDPILSTPCVHKERDQGLEKDLVEALYEYEGLAVAAPQIGSLTRVFVYDLRDGEGPQFVYDPILNFTINDTATWIYTEGCLSVPGLSFPVERPKNVHLVGFNTHGDLISKDATGLEARCYQHEVDHLNGYLYVDKCLTKGQKAIAKQKYRGPNCT